MRVVDIVINYVLLDADTITLPIEIFKNATLPRMPRESSTSILKQSLRQSIGRSSLSLSGLSLTSALQTKQYDSDVHPSARLSLPHYPMSETTQHRRSLSVGEAWRDEAVNQIGRYF